MQDPDEPKYQLTLVGQGVEIKRSLPEALALRVIALVMGGSEAPVSSPATARTPAVGALTLGEFLHERAASRNPDKILGIAAYLIDQLGKTGVTKDEVRSQFQTAGQALPGNFARDFAWTVSNRWLAPSHDNPGEYFVTATGRKALDEGFGADVKKASKFKPRGRKRASRQSAQQ